MRRRGILFIVSAPSGAGKTTLCDNLRKTPDFYYSVSCTTRPPRKGEVDGEDYFFIGETLFLQRVKKGWFLEHAVVHGHHYGTPLHAVKIALAQGKDLLLDIDVQGAGQIRKSRDRIIRSSLVSVFLITKTLAELERRLRKRATDDEATIQRRLAAARKEMSHWPEYDYVVFTGTPEEDVQKFRAIVQAETHRTSRMRLGEIF